MLISDAASGILYRSWKAQAPLASAVLVHGMGGHSQRWEFLAHFLLQNNITSYALELKGFGQTQERQGHINSFLTYYRDIRSLYEIVQQDLPGKKVFLVGESLGGLLAFIFATQRPNPFCGLICISPAFESKLRIGLLTKLNVFLSVLCCPARQFKMPLDSAQCTRDEDYLAIMRQDEREHRLASAQLLFNTLLAQAAAKRIKNELGIPVLFLLSGKDTIVDSSLSRKVFHRLALEDKTIIEYPQMLHAIPIDLDRQKAFADIAEWIKRRA